MKTAIAAIFVLSAAFASFPVVELLPKATNEGPALSVAGGQEPTQATAQPTVLFWTQNGKTVDERPPERRELPRLVLKRNGALTPEYERTLTLPLSSLPLPGSATQ